MSRFKAGRLAAPILLSLTLIAGQPATADTYPSKPVRLVVGFAAGGATDLLARLVADKLSQKLGQSVIVDNRSGAGGTIGANMVAKAPPDGYMLLSASVSNAVIAPAVMANVPYDPEKDFAPVMHVASVPLLLVVPAQTPFQSTKDLIALAKSKPGALNYSSGGTGTSVHLAGALFNKLADVNLLHIPFRGDTPAVAALLANEVTMMFAARPSVEAYVKAGTMRALGVSSAQRLASLPSLPTVAESLPGFEVEVWHGILAPPGTPADIVQKIHDAIAGSLPEMTKPFADLGFEPGGGTAESFAAMIRADVPKWQRIVTDADAKEK